MIEKFKKYLYDNESRIKRELYDKYPDKMNMFCLEDIHATLVIMFINDNDDNPFSEKYDSLAATDVTTEIIMPFLSKKNETLYFDVIVKTDAMHDSIDLHECGILLHRGFITFKQYVDKLKQYGYDVNVKIHKEDGQILAKFYIVKVKSGFFGGGCQNICDLKFYKQPYRNRVYSLDEISKEDVGKFFGNVGVSYIY